METNYETKRKSMKTILTEQLWELNLYFEPITAGVVATIVPSFLEQQSKRHARLICVLLGLESKMQRIPLWSP